MTAPEPRLGTLLILGRVSNLPTVWSNCLAAWLLNGGGNGFAFLLLCCGSTLLYVGGMYLNDAFDADFDGEFRPERPIPSGRIAARDVWWMGGLFMLFGWLLLFLLGNAVGLLALALVAAIVFYDAVHKRTEVAPFLMALCRLLLCVVAGMAASDGISVAVFWHGGALMTYIVGLSFWARGESHSSEFTRWPQLLLFVPLAANIWIDPSRSAFSWVANMGLLAWLIWGCRDVARQAKPDVGRVVASLLAGIVLVDCAALPRLSVGEALIFLGLFFLARLAQRIIPAT